MERQVYFRLLTPSLDISPSGLVYFSQNLIKLQVFFGDCIFEHLEQILPPSYRIDRKGLGGHFKPRCIKKWCWILWHTHTRDLLLNLGTLNLVILLKLYFLENSGYNTHFTSLCHPFLHKFSREAWKHTTFDFLKMVSFRFGICQHWEYRSLVIVTAQHSWDPLFFLQYTSGWRNSHYSVKLI